MDDEYTKGETITLQALADSEVVFTPPSVLGFRPKKSEYKFTVEADGKMVVNVQYDRKLIEYCIDDGEKNIVKYGATVKIDCVKENKVFRGIYLGNLNPQNLYSDKNEFIINDSESKLNFYTLYQHQYDIYLKYPDKTEDHVIQYGDSYSLDSYKKPGYIMNVNEIDKEKSDGKTEVIVTYDEIIIEIYNFNNQSDRLNYELIKTYSTTKLIRNDKSKLTYQLIMDRLTEDGINFGEYYLDEHNQHLFNSNITINQNLKLYSRKFNEYDYGKITIKLIAKIGEINKEIRTYRKDNLIIGGNYSLLDLCDSNPLFKMLNKYRLDQENPPTSIYITPGEKQIDIYYDYSLGYHTVRFLNSSSTETNKFIFPKGEPLMLSNWPNYFNWYYLDSNGNKIFIDEEIIVNHDIDIFYEIK